MVEHAGLQTDAGYNCSEGWPYKVSDPFIALVHQIGVRDLVARGYSTPGRISQRWELGRWRSVSHFVRAGLEQTSEMSGRDGFRQPYSTFSNRPHPLSQKRFRIQMGFVRWRVTE